MIQVIPTGGRKLAGLMAAVAASTVVAVMGILHGSDVIGLAGLVAAINTPYLYFMGGNVGEWKARAADQSSIPDQVAAEKKVT